MVKMVEVDEAEFNQMVALRQVASKMVAKPESRRLLEQAQKLVDPNAPTPLLDAEAAQLAPVKEMEKKLADEIAALKKERDDEKREAMLATINGKQEAAFKRLKSEHRYTDEGVEAVRKLMETKGLIDVDDAVAIFERTNPPQMPATPSGGMTGSAWNFADVTAEVDKSIQDLIATKGQNDQIADRMATAALNEFRGQARH
jgi:hypothetical protein